ncbi:MAG TPA: type II toxin-antitoxin system PemK/MazF family toxin [Candidatus Saccharimonadales bacterium]|jgi:mRNA interferase MazF
MSKLPHIPERGDIVWLILDPRVGHEQSGRRPALVLSPKVFTEHTGLAVVCPITSKVKSLPFEIVVKQAKIDGAVLPIHIRSVDVVARKCSFIEKASKSVLRRTEQSVKAIIGST